MSDDPHAFVAYLQRLATAQDRGALAALRRGLGQPPGTVAAMYPYVVPWLPADAPPWIEAPYYLVAALFAWHPLPGGSGTLGASFRRTMGNDSAATAGESERISATERRFTALLAAHPDDLPDYLRQAVGFLAAQDQPVDWDQLFSDLPHWGDASRNVQRAWARDFWGRVQAQDQNQAQDQSAAKGAQ